jgi:hypothetical protein
MLSDFPLALINATSASIKVTLVRPSLSGVHLLQTNRDSEEPATSRFKKEKGLSPYDTRLWVEHMPIPNGSRAHYLLRISIFKSTWLTLHGSSWKSKIKETQMVVM